jgi:large conductance mechanosensitive channel
MIKEFRDFIMRGNVLELAVAVIVASAFGGVITSFTNDILMPPIGMALNSVDFEDLKFVLQAADSDKPEVAILYGKWINTVITFLITSSIIFIIVKAYNKTQSPKEEAALAGPSDNQLLTEIRDLLKK